jgi:hypothetical protein
MKRFIRTAGLLATLFSIAVVASACGSSSGSSTTARPGMIGTGVTPGYGGTVMPIPGGAIQVSFTAMNAYNSPTFVSAGVVYVNGNSASPYRGTYWYDGFFSNNYYDKWFFTNNLHSGYTPTMVSVGAAGLPVGAPGTETYASSAPIEPGMTVTMVASAPTSYYGVPVSNVAGTVTIPPAFIQLKRPSGTFAAISSIAFDFAKSTIGSTPGTYRIDGGMLISFADGSPGLFLRL